MKRLLLLGLVLGASLSFQNKGFAEEPDQVFRLGGGDRIAVYEGVARAECKNVEGAEDVAEANKQCKKKLCEWLDTQLIDSEDCWKSVQSKNVKVDSEGKKESKVKNTVNIGLEIEVPTNSVYSDPQGPTEGKRPVNLGIKVDTVPHGMVGEKTGLGWSFGGVMKFNTNPGSDPGFEDIMGLEFRTGPAVIIKNDEGGTVAQVTIFGFLDAGKRHAGSDKLGKSVTGYVCDEGVTDTSQCDTQTVKLKENGTPLAAGVGLDVKANIIQTGRFTAGVNIGVKYEHSIGTGLDGATVFGGIGGSF